jgi:hypothetical protein
MIDDAVCLGIGLACALLVGMFVRDLWKGKVKK